MSIHTGNGRSVSAALHDTTAYVENPDKTNGGEFVTAYECDPQTVDSEFALSKRQYAAMTGRSQGKSDVIAYHIRQSFKPGEASPEEANEIGRELALRFTKGNHAFIVATHIDKRHCHNHVIFNSTALDNKNKFRDFKRSGMAIRKISDQLCAEHGLSIVESPKPSRGNYGSWLGDRKTPSYQEKLRQTIDAVLPNCKTFDEFLATMKSAGYTVKFGNHLAFKGTGQKKFTRCDTLKGDYTDQAIIERLAGKRIVAQSKPTQKISLLIDIQRKIQEGKGDGYAQYAKIRNLKEMAKTLIYLQKQKIDGYDILREKSESASKNFNDLLSKIKTVDSRLQANSNLQKHIVNYSKTRAVYVEYRKNGYSKKFKDTHESDILLHQSAKKAFDELGLKKLPTIASLRQEYAQMLAEKKNLYKEYTPAKSEMRELLTAKNNVERLLNLKDNSQEVKKNQPEL